MFLVKQHPFCTLLVWLQCKLSVKKQQGRGREVENERNSIVVYVKRSRSACRSDERRLNGWCVCVCARVRAFQCLSSRYWFNQLPLSCYTDTEAVCRDQNCTAWPKVRQSVCIIFTPRRGDERVCLSVCVCLSAIISLELHVRSSPIFC